MAAPEDLLRLALALAAGLLIGLERGWHSRDRPEGVRVAGVRTFALLALLGAGSALLTGPPGEGLAFALAFVAVAVLLVGTYAVAAPRRADYGITTLVAALLTFLVGALAVRSPPALAAALAVVVTVLLGVKPVLHRWIERLERRDLHAIFKMALLSVVVLPVLPDRGYGPWQALNPFEIWSMVVLIAAVSFTGYFAMKVAGPERGLGATALGGGLVSSTAVTLGFSRLHREMPEHEAVLSAGVLAAAGTMFPRTLVLAGVLHPPLLAPLAPPLLAMAALCYGIAAWVWPWRRPAGGAGRPGEVRNPFELGTALKFGVLLAGVMIWDVNRFG